MLHPLRTQSKVNADAASDHAVMKEMMAELRNALVSAIDRCQAKSRGLKQVDADQLMVDIKSLFDPTQRTAVQDLFADAFLLVWEKRYGCVNLPLWERDELPSGARKGE